MNTELDVTIIIPAYHEAEIIADVIGRVRLTMDGLNRSYEILVIDDGSKDDTAIRAKNAGARVISHPYNIGNGAAVKTGIRQAKGTVLVMMDGDGQHNPEYIPQLLEKIGQYDMVVGARTGDSESHLPPKYSEQILQSFCILYLQKKDTGPDLRLPGNQNRYCPPVCFVIA